ncbi:ATP-binding protein [Lichenihabitans sp. Uapishka_5]|uniref:ATP-binding protein n=1 Tax=Lichenihabitans sp. Uapishka_5 TaxID=3037302 RepID=UPI0029E7F4AB|nr:ATP-binding protein [Lichenihabitans sp. Uapishka_5]
MTVTTISEANSELTLRLRQQELAAEFATFSLQHDEVQPVLDEACRVAAKGMECTLSKVLEFLPSDGEFVMRAGLGWHPGSVGHVRLGADLASPAGFAFQTGQPVLSNHLANETRFRTPKLLVEHGVHRAFNVLVETPDWRYGVLEVDSPDERDFSISDTAFLQTLAATLALAIAKANRRRDLSESEARYRALSETLEMQVVERTRERDRLWELSEDLLVVADYDGRLLRINPAWGRLLGKADADIVRDGYPALIHPDDLARVEATLLEMRSEGASARYTNRIEAQDGHWIWISWTLSPEPGGERLTGVGRDVTAEREEAALRERLEDQLRQSQKMEAVGQLTGGLAHDFNNLLTGIVGSLEMMNTRIAQGRIKDLERYIGAAQGAATRAAALTHRLLAFSRRQTLDPKPVRFDALVEGISDLVRRTVGPGIEVSTLAEPGLWNALCDPNQLENALLNLAINARDAMPDGGRLTIKSENVVIDWQHAGFRDMPAGQFVAVSVTDTGSGMPAEVVARAFDPFFTTKPLGVGTGLGLSMVYGFCKQSGGQVRIHSLVGEGTTVTIYLPRDASGFEAETEDKVHPTVPNALAGQTVLVVDDEPTVRLLVTDVLQDLGYAAIEAADGASGLKVLQSDVRIDLLVSDVGLPGGMNGRQMADAARVRRPDLKVLFITGYAEGAAVRDAALDTGMHVMTKPFAMDALAARIGAIIKVGD